MDELLNSYKDRPNTNDNDLPPLKKIKVNATPDVPDVFLKSELYIPNAKELHYNVPADVLYRPREGPTFPHLPHSLSSEKNCWTGVVVPSYQSDHTFKQQFNTYHRFGYANDPAAPLYNSDGTQNFVGNKELGVKNKGVTVYEINTKEKKKRRATGDKDPSSDKFLGPWAPYEDDIMNSDSEEEDSIDNESNENIKNEEEKDNEKDKEEKKEEKEEEDKKIQNNKFKERTILHKKERYDYLGRTYISPPSEVKVREHDCFLPKKRIHTWTGHTKPISTIELFPNTGHLLLSSDLDGKIKIWDVYNKRRVLRTFIAHPRGIKDINFSSDGTQFISASLDKRVKLWDTESGQVIGSFKHDSTPLCCKLYPKDNNIFISGCYDKQITQWDTRTGEIELYYDRNLGPVNSVTFVDDDRRFVSTSDDKSLRIWDWNTPVEIKYISEPHMHSMPCVAVSHSKKWMACQSLDNQILIYSAQDRFKMNRKKCFKGHIVAGYACQPTFSTDGKYIASGDSGGFLYIWDWKSHKIFKRIKAHDSVCISSIWHPIEASKVITAGWDGRIHLWD